MFNNVQTTHGLTVLTRLAQREPESEKWLYQVLRENILDLAEQAVAVAVESGEPMGRILTSVLRDYPSVDVAKKIDEYLPAYNVTLLELSVEAARQRVAAEQALSGNDSQLAQAKVASLLCKYARRLIAAGQYEEALRASRKAVAFFRLLDLRKEEEKVDLETLTLEGWTVKKWLATGLDLTSTSLYRLGNYGAAVGPAEEALQILRSLYSDQPHVSIAEELANLGNRLEAIGDIENALAVNQQAIGMFRSLLESTPRDWRFQMEDASLEQDRPTVVMRPPQGEPLRLERLGEHPDLGAIFIPTMDEAHKNRGGEVFVNPFSDTPENLRYGLAIALMNRVSLLIKSRDLDRSKATAEEALTTLIGLAEGTPDSYKPYLASSYFWVSSVFLELELYHEAQQAAREGVSIYRKLASSHPNAFADHFILMLTQFRDLTSSLAKYGETLDVLIELYDLRDYRASDSHFLPDLESHFIRLALLLRDDHCLEEAISAWEYAVKCQRILVKTDRGYLADLAFSLKMLADGLASKGAAEKAETALGEADAILTDLAQPEKASLHSFLDLSRKMRNIDRKEEAFLAVDIALSLFAPLFLESPPDNQESLQKLLSAYMDSSEEAGHDLDPSKPLDLIVNRLLATLQDGDSPNLWGDLCLQVFKIVAAYGKQQDPHRTREIFDNFSRLAEFHPDSQELQVAKAMIGFNVVLYHSEAGLLEQAKDVHRQLMSIRAPYNRDTLIMVEQAKSAWTLIAALIDSGDRSMAGQVARTAESSLKSDEYLSLRAEVFENESLDDYLALIDELINYGSLGKRPVFSIFIRFSSFLKHLKRW